MAEVVVRELAAGDLPDVLRLWEAAGLSHEPEGRDRPSALGRQRAAAPDLWLGAFDGRSLVGVVVGTDDGRKGYVNRLAVHPEHRRRGLARRLLRRCESALAERGRRVITGLVEEGSAASLELFRSEGYAARCDITYVRKSLDGRYTGC